MSVILLETSHPCQTGEGTRELIAMEHTKVSHPQGQLPPRPRSVVKHDTAGEEWREEGEGEQRGGKGERRRRSRDEEERRRYVEC